MTSSSHCQKFIKHFQKFVEDYNRELLGNIKTNVTSLSDEQKQELDSYFQGLSTKFETQSTKPQKKKRQPTAYNLFMRDTIKNLKISHPDVDRKELMSMGAKMWQDQKKN